MAKIKDEIKEFIIIADQIKSIVEWYNSDNDSQLIPEKSIQCQIKFQGPRYPENIHVKI